MFVFVTCLARIEYDHRGFLSTNAIVYASDSLYDRLGISRLSQDADKHGACQIKAKSWRIVAGDDDAIDLVDCAGEELSVWMEDEMRIFRQLRAAATAKSETIVGYTVMQITVFYDSDPEEIFSSSWEL